MTSPVVQQMLTAAAHAAGAQWGTIRADLEAFATNLANDCTATAANLAAGTITPDDARAEMRDEANEAAIIANYAELTAKRAAEDAINAAIDVLWAAIQKGPI
jgi:hypothetical protein